MLSAAEFGHLSCVIARIVLRLIAGLLLLVQNDESQIAEGCKNPRAGSDDHFGVSPSGPFPLVVSLACGERAVQYRYPAAKLGHKLAQKLRGQSDFRDEHQGGLAPLQCSVDEVDIDSRLSRAGNAVEQGAAGFVLDLKRMKPFVNCPLLLVQGGTGLLFRLIHLRAAKHLPLVNGQDAHLLQLTQGLLFGPGEIGNVLGGGRAYAGEQGDHRFAELRTALGHQLLRLVRRNCQHGDVLCLVSHAPLGTGLQDQYACILKGAKCLRGIGLAAGLPKCFSLNAAAVGTDDVQNTPLQIRGQFLLCLRQVQSGGNGIAVLQIVVQSCRQHGLDRIVNGTVILLPHPEGQADALPVHHRSIVQNHAQPFQPALGQLLRSLQNDAFGAAVAPAKGNDDPHAGQQRVRKAGGDQIGIGLVNGKCSGFHCHLAACDSTHVVPSLLLGCKQKSKRHG